MAGSASFCDLGGMSSGPADLFSLIAFSLRRTLQTVISVTEGTKPVCSLCCGKLLLARPSLVPILANKSFIKFGLGRDVKHGGRSFPCSARDCLKTGFWQ